MCVCVWRGGDEYLNIQRRTTVSSMVTKHHMS